MSCNLEIHVFTLGAGWRDDGGPSPCASGRAAHRRVCGRWLAAADCVTREPNAVVRAAQAGGAW